MNSARIFAVDASKNIVYEKSNLWKRNSLLQRAVLN